MSVFLVYGVQFTGAACIRCNVALLMLPGRKKKVVGIVVDEGNRI